jgi:hypothetical protein
VPHPLGLNENPSDLLGDQQVVVRKAEDLQPVFDECRLMPVADFLVSSESDAPVLRGPGNPLDIVDRLKLLRTPHIRPGYKVHARGPQLGNEANALCSVDEQSNQATARSALSTRIAARTSS